MKEMHGHVALAAIQGGTAQKVSNEADYAAQLLLERQGGIQRSAASLRGSAHDHTPRVPNALDLLSDESMQSFADPKKTLEANCIFGHSTLVG
mmetsp:Transcript_51548/g.96549  ORF Transcript_51548/g.96549 Transcript_51548/m.96549 type:complete len:93 (-) Transcript_51548:831-1109(-)